MKGQKAKFEMQAVYMSEVNASILNTIARRTGNAKSEVMRFAITKAFANPMWAEQEFDCPGLAEDIRSAIKSVGK